jgi:hypothetical protein
LIKQRGHAVSSLPKITRDKLRGGGNHLSSMRKSDSADTAD